ncbi:hypothetical protein Godav_028107, partial [Gossypium davidsonii]|nr:hypothetical protein [Gossypium davidsonii]
MKKAIELTEQANIVGHIGGKEIARVEWIRE